MLSISFTIVLKALLIKYTALCWIFENYFMQPLSLRVVISGKYQAAALKSIYRITIAWQIICIAKIEAPYIDPVNPLSIYKLMPALASICSQQCQKVSPRSSQIPRYLSAIFIVYTIVLGRTSGIYFSSCFPSSGLIKWINTYFLGLNTDAYLDTQTSACQYTLWSFEMFSCLFFLIVISAILSIYILDFISLYPSTRSVLQIRYRIGERGKPYRIPVSIRIYFDIPSGIYIQVLLAIRNTFIQDASCPSLLLQRLYISLL